MITHSLNEEKFVEKENGPAILERLFSATFGFIVQKRKIFFLVHEICGGDARD
jgi:hypothetical protein